MLGGEEVAHLGGERSGVLEQERVSGIAVEHESGRIKVRHGNIGSNGGDHHVVHAIGIQHGLLDGFQLSLNEGALFGNVRPSPQPPGRGRLVTRERGIEVVQLAWTDPTQ